VAIPKPRKHFTLPRENGNVNTEGTLLSEKGDRLYGGYVKISRYRGKRGLWFYGG
jgi:hypothetical protein